MTYRGMTRRELMQLAATTGVGLLAGARAAAAKAPGTIGVQLYTVRDLIAKAPAETLKAIADIGYKEVEVIRGTMDTVVPLAKADGMNPVSVHVDSVLITGNWDSFRQMAARFPAMALPEGYDLAACIRDVKAAGAKFIVMPYLAPPERPKDAAGFKAFGETLNKAGEQIKKAGLQLCYHNHAFEFTPLDGRTRALDVLLASANPDLVKLELDVFWVSVAGADPVALIKQHGSRIALMHLKDKMKGAPVSLTEAVPPSTFVEVGSGALNFPEILDAAQAAGVQHYFVEQDQTAGNPIDSLRKSYQYLRSLT